MRRGRAEPSLWAGPSPVQTGLRVSELTSLQRGKGGKDRATPPTRHDVTVPRVYLTERGGTADDSLSRDAVRTLVIKQVHGRAEYAVGLAA